MKSAKELEHMEHAKELENDLIEILGVYIKNSNEKEKKHKQGDWSYRLFNVELATRKREKAVDLIEYFSKAKQDRELFVQIFKKQNLPEVEDSPEKSDSSCDEQPDAKKPSDERLRTESSSPGDKDKPQPKPKSKPKQDFIEDHQIILLKMLLRDIDNYENKINNMKAVVERIEKEHWCYWGGDMEISLNSCQTQVDKARKELDAFRINLERGMQGVIHPTPVPYTPHYRSQPMSATSEHLGVSPSISMTNASMQEFSPSPSYGATLPSSFVPSGFVPTGFDASSVNLQGHSSATERHPLFKGK